MMTSSPCFQLAGVATLCFAVSCMESRTRRISSKLRPVVVGAELQLDPLVGADDEDGADGGVGGRGAAFAAAGLVGREHVVELGDLEVDIADHGVVDGVAGD